MTCPILNLPNEILNETFSYIHTPIASRHYVGEGRFSEIFGIRSVCRRFRAVSNELSFWYDENFDLLDLIPNRKWHDYVKLHRDCEAFLKVLLSDNHLVQSLARRSSWHFENLISLRSVMEFVPSFFQNTTTIVLLSDFTRDEEREDAGEEAGIGHSGGKLSLRGLSYFEESEFRNVSPSPMRINSPSPIEIIFSNLVRCHRLTSLHLSQFREPFDLELIVQFCPRLRELSFHSINQYRGTLRGLSCVEDFDVRELTSRVGAANDHIFPISSAKSLTRLSIVHQECMFDNDEPNPRWPPFLKTFVNLTSLCISPFTNEICDFIVRSDLRLVDFRIQLVYDTEITASKVAEMFSAPSLRNVRHLRFTVDVRPVDRIYFRSYLQAIISNMSSLEELCIAMPLDLSWCELLGYLGSLKKLRLCVPDNDCRDSEVLLFRTDDLDRPTEKDYNKGDDKKSHELLTRAFDAAFQHFMTKPVIKAVVTVEDDVFPEWLELMTADSDWLF
jgi:hypothetical protein